MNNSGLVTIPEYVVTIPLGDYADQIEAQYKYKLLVNALLGALEYNKYSTDDSKLKINNSVLVILKQLESVGYGSVVKQIIEKNEPKEETIVEKTEE